MYNATDEEINELEECVAYIEFGTLPSCLAVVASAIDKYGPQGDPDPITSQALNVVEEAGEFIAEFRRLKGFARRPGDREAMLSELADVIISSFIMFERLDAVAEEEIRKKLEKVVTRGFNHH